MSEPSEGSRLGAAAGKVGTRIRVVGQAALQRNPSLVVLAITQGEKGVMLDRRAARRKPGEAKEE